MALRKTMLKAHLQAWVWQDEWHGLTMEVRRAIRILFSAPAAKKERQAVVAFFSLGCFPLPRVQLSAFILETVGKHIMGHSSTHSFVPFMSIIFVATYEYLSNEAK